MQIRRTLLSLPLALLAAKLGAAPRPQADSSRLAGTWFAQATRADGVTLETLMTLTRDGKFSGSVKANGKPFMTFDGTWTLAGQHIEWTYSRSDPPLPESLRKDSDELVSVDDKRLVLVSKISGKTRTFARR